MSICSYIAMPYSKYLSPLPPSFQTPSQTFNPVLTDRSKPKTAHSSKFEWISKMAGGIAGCLALERYGLIAELVGCCIGYATVDSLLKTKTENQQLKKSSGQIKVGNQRSFWA